MLDLNQSNVPFESKSAADCERNISSAIKGVQKGLIRAERKMGSAIKRVQKGAIHVDHKERRIPFTSPTSDALRERPCAPTALCPAALDLNQRNVPFELKIGADNERNGMQDYSIQMGHKQE